jgi:serine/threonine protein kinase
MTDSTNQLGDGPGDENVDETMQPEALPEGSEKRNESLLGKTTISLATVFETSSDDIDAMHPLFSPPAKPDAIATLGNYHIYGKLGRGGFGTVFRASDSELWRPVAIKLLNRNLSSSVVARRRFIREARAAASISHVNVVTIYSVESKEDTPFIVMELIEGRTLQEKLKVEKRIDVVESIRIAHQIACGLAAAHAQGVIHRDIKPANILLSGAVENVKISDFGVARAAIDNVDLTASEMAVGTPAFMSPEAIRGETVDARSDLFALGCVMYGMLAGHSPFHGGSSFEVAHNVVSHVPPTLCTINPAVPPFLSELVERLLEKSPHRRVQSAQELSEILGHYLAQLNSSPSDKHSLILRQSLPRRTQSVGKRWASAVALAVVISLGAILGFFATRPWWNELPAIAPTTAPPELHSPVVVERVPKIFVSQQGDGDCRSIREAINRVEKDGEIIVKDAGRYFEPVQLNNEVAGVSVIATHGAWLQSDGKFVVSVNDCPNASIRGFNIDARGDQVAIDVNRDCTGLVLADLKIEKSRKETTQIASIWIKGYGTESSPVQFQNVVVNNATIGLVIDGIDGRGQHIVIRNCAIRGVDDISVLVNLNASRNVLVSDSLLEHGVVGFSIVTTKSSLDKVELARCTVANCSSFVNWSGNVADSNLRVVDTLLWKVRYMWNSGRAEWFENNVWLPTPDSTNRTSTLVNTVEQIKMLSEKPDDPDYLVPESWGSLNLARPVGHAATRIKNNDSPESL